MSAGGAWKVLKKSGSEFMDDNAMMISAALAFYSALSLAPLIIIFIWATSMLGPETQQHFIDQVRNFVGAQAGEAIEMIVNNAKERPSVGNFAGAISIATLLFSATGVFVQLQKAMNVIWDVKPKPGQGVMGWISKRLVSLGMVLTIGFLLLVSLILSAALSAMIGRMEGTLPGANYLWQILEIVVSLLVYVLLFAAIFKFLPDVRIEWREVWGGAIVTAVLFAAGKFAIGLYLGQSSVGSAYGAAGSLVVLLVWVYYSAIILFFGAELTQVGARRLGHEITPNKHAQWADRKFDHRTPQPA